MTAPIFRRSLLSLPTRTVAANVSARSSGLRNTGKRALGTSSLTLSTLRPAYSIATRTERKSFLTPTQIRYKSDNGPDSPRKWGFEDISSSLPASSGSPPSHPQENLILVDVREPAELVDTGVIPSAVSVPLQSQPDALFLSPDEFETRFGYPKPGLEEDEGHLVFYCKAGIRARTAASLAVQAGYDPARIGVYEGSWLDWMEKGGKVEKWQQQ